MKLPVIPHDKAQHFIYGALIALVTMYLALFLNVHRDMAKLVGVGAAVVAGTVKEFIVDRRANKAAAAEGSGPVATTSNADLAATALGGILVWLA